LKASLQRSDFVQQNVANYKLIVALSAPLRMLAKIVQQNLLPVVRRSDLILKRAQFIYAISLRLPFSLCKHILGVILRLWRHWPLFRGA
jgi:hypothetical protein